MFPLRAAALVLPLLLAGCQGTPFGDRLSASFPGGPATAQGLLFLSGLGAVYAAAYMKHMLSLRFAPASGVAPYFNLEPVVTTAIAATVLGERLQINQYAGGGLVLVALVASSMLGKWKE